MASDKSEIQKTAKELAHAIKKLGKPSDSDWKDGVDDVREEIWKALRPVYKYEKEIRYKDAGATKEDKKALSEALLKNITENNDGNKELARENYINVLKGKPATEMELHYDSFGEGLEPVYYWVIDALRNGEYTPVKTDDFLAASEASFYYGDIGGRRTAMEKRASELMGTINMVIKSILNLVWDLKEFQARLTLYKDYFQEEAKSIDEKKKTDADLGLKAIWLTEVDIKKGRGSINMLAQELNFVTIRDAFMIAKSPEDVDKLDLNQRVKNVLKPRVSEYQNWVKLSFAELKRRFEIEKAYLKSQYQALQTYTDWAKPYVIATQKLMPKRKGELAEAEAVVGFDVAHIYIDLLASKKAKVKHLPTVSAKGPGKDIEFPDERKSEQVLQVVEVVFDYRASPSGVAERGHYYHRGYVRVTFRGFVMSQWDFDQIKKQEDMQALEMLNVTAETTQQIDSAIEEFNIFGGKKEEKKEKKGEGAFEGVGKGFREMLEPLTSVSKSLGGGKALGRPTPWEVKRVMLAATKDVSKYVLAIYRLYKKTHAMLDWI